MPRDYFAQMSRQRSHRHDQPHDSEVFNQDMSLLCGALYSVITLKAFFPSRPISGPSKYEKKIKND